MSKTWRSQILKEFTPRASCLTLVADPDGLLLEEGVLQAIRERGFDLIPFEDPVAFRFAYESKYRAYWDQGERSDLVVTVGAGKEALNALPYDLLRIGRKLSFDLGRLFPGVSYPVISALDAGDLDALYNAFQRHKPGSLGDNATKEFVLRHVFKIAPELIKKPSDLLRVLLRRHFRNQRLPDILDERLIHLLRDSALFNDWPLEKIVPGRTEFFLFLQERWPAFLNRLTASETESVHDCRQSYGFELPGALDIPFDHDDVRVYIDNLFLEGFLRPISYEKAGKLADSWVSVGIAIDQEKDRERRLKGLIKSIRATLPGDAARHQDWLDFAHRWAELVVLVSGETTGQSNDISRDFQILQKAVDNAFRSWCEKRYPGLYNQPPSPPVMIHHIPRALARVLNETPKIALIVVDGLSLDQWAVLREVLYARRPGSRFRESAVFAWVPTITSVSRQALFSGKPPFYFPGSIKTTAREPLLWSRFWMDQGLQQSRIAYMKSLGDGELKDVEEMLSDANIRVAGLVVDMVDKIMHGMELGAAGMHNQVRQWGGQGYLAELIDLLHSSGFKIWLTSDHGNLEARGGGRPAEGVTAEVRGERARIYPTAALRDKVRKRFPAAIAWPPHGLPDNYYPLLAPGRSAFIKEGALMVGHGGLSLEETVVPFIEIESPSAREAGGA